MRYVGKIYRPPSEADSYILQATIGCSWNHCTYCDMYRDKAFAVRPLAETLDDLAAAGRLHGPTVEKVFVADGDALILSMEHWRAILDGASAAFPRLRRVSCYAMARNVLAKSPAQLAELRARGLDILYIGPESGDDPTLKRIAKGDDHAQHVAAAGAAHAAGLRLSVIALLGIGRERWREHAEATADLVTAMDPAFFSALTITVVPGTPLHAQEERGDFVVPAVPRLLEELRIVVARTRPSDALFRTNHASNHLSLGGRLSADRTRILQAIDAALAEEIPLRPEWMRGL